MDRSVNFVTGANRETNPEIDNGFDSNATGSAISFTSKLLGKDIMSIVMKRHIGGIDNAEVDQPVAKKAKTETNSSEPYNVIVDGVEAGVGVNSYESDSVTSTNGVEGSNKPLHESNEPEREEKESEYLDDSDIKEINLSLDILNGSASSGDIDLLDRTVENVKDLKANESHLGKESEAEVDQEFVEQVADEVDGSTAETAVQPSTSSSSKISKSDPDNRIVKDEHFIDNHTRNIEPKAEAINSKTAFDSTEQNSCKTVGDNDSGVNLDIVKIQKTEKIANLCMEEKVKLKEDKHSTAADNANINRTHEQSVNCDSKIKDDIDANRGSVKDECGTETRADSKDRHGDVNNQADIDVSTTAADKKQQINANLEVDGDKACKTRDARDKKKSRKQSAPRRIAYTATNMTEDQFEETTEGFEIENTHNHETSTEQNKLDFVIDDAYKSEKSRKQNKPMRITHNFDDTVEETYYDNVESNLSDLTKARPSVACESVLDAASDVESKDSTDETFYTAQYNDESFNTADASSPNISFNSLQNLFPFIQGRNMSQYQNEMLATLSQSLFQSQVNTDDSQSSIGNLEENLDVVRKLREIRFYKYRKITVSEKQEIATFAKVHGVSAAAARYGVSKSAVSMWTRTDFTGMTDEMGKRKRNCMLGNEKFEQLLVRVRNEKFNKFKALSKADKFEVSRYAKLVGVREMARCLGIALGTVSGWMRQFPYNPKPEISEEEGNSGESKEANEVNDNSLNNSQDESLDSTNPKTHLDFDSDNEASNSATFASNETKSQNYLDCRSSSTKTKEDGNSVNKIDDDKTDVKSKHADCPKKVEQAEASRVNEDESSALEADDANSRDSTVTIEYNEDETGKKGEDKDEESSAAASHKKKSDEVDEMIAETFLAPDIDKSFENIKDQIKDTPLENDEFFESLFRRVLSCRVAKYKTLKPSEKLEVVRYAKRNGVRRVAKLLGLATGTLSGWNTKYQALLGLTMDGCPPSSPASQEPSTSSHSADTSVGFSSPSPAPIGDNVSTLETPDRESSSASLTATPSSSSVLDNAEKSEVMALKMLMKEQFPILVKKIEVARQVKFRNITTAEKIEIVKCAKLVGIRPTARVLGMPIGTLSGWITKYSNTLHPVYHVDSVEGAEAASATPPYVETTPESDALRNEALAKNLALMGQHTAGLMSGYSVPPNMNMFNTAGLGLVSNLPNSFSQNFISRLNQPDFTGSDVKQEVKNNESTSTRSLNDSAGNSDTTFTGADAVANSGKAFEGLGAQGSNVGGFSVGLGFSLSPAPGISEIDAETKRMAEQYVKMFNDAQMMKYGSS